MRIHSVAVEPVGGDMSGLMAENLGQQFRAAGPELFGEDDPAGGRATAPEASFQPGAERDIDVVQEPGQAPDPPPLLEEWAYLLGTRRVTQRLVPTQPRPPERERTASHSEQGAGRRSLPVTPTGARCARCSERCP